MDHEHWKAKLYEFYDGELHKEEALAFSAHLESCLECRSELESWKAAALVSFKESQISAPSGFSGRVMDRIFERAGALGEAPVPAPVFSPFFLPKWEWAAAFSVGFLVLSYFSVHALKSKEPAAETPAAWVESQAGAERWVFSEREMGKDDLLGLAVGDEALNDSDPEVIL